jgi:Uma2 family endonuclease
MSTVPGRSSQTDTKPSFRYGYRLVRIKLPNGRSRFKRVPLTLKDVLHPRFGDFHVLSQPHNEDCHYLYAKLAYRVRTDASAVVLQDCGIFWDIPRLRHHSPDISVIFGVRERKDWKTFDVRIEKVRPSLIIEVTSPSTRVNDVKTKVKQYARARVPYYVIADAVEKNEVRRLKLRAYRLDGQKYVRVPLDAHGRAWLEPLKLWLGIRVHPRTGGDRLVLVDPVTNEPLPNLGELGDSLVARTAALAEADEAREQAEDRVRIEALAREQAEDRARIEALAREQADEAREQAEDRARIEALAREQAEDRARIEALAREQADEAREQAEDRARAAEQRLRELEEKLKKPRRRKSP